MVGRGIMGGAAGGCEEMGGEDEAMGSEGT